MEETKATNVRRVKRTPAEMVDWYHKQIRHAKEKVVTAQARVASCEEKLTAIEEKINIRALLEEMEREYCLKKKEIKSRKPFDI